MTRRRMFVRDEGSSLIESVVALFIASIVFLALTSSLLSAMKSSVFGRTNQQAVDFATRAVEDARQLGFGSLGHLATDLVIAGDSRITSCGSDKCFDSGAGSEKLHTLVGAGIPLHLQTLNGNETNKTPYTLGTYVTEVSGQPASQLLRVTAVITWRTGPTPHTRKVSTLVAQQQRGLPTPVYNFATSSSANVTKAPGGQFVYAMTLTNQGAPDRWNLPLSGPGATKGWVLYRDVNANNTYDAGVDVALTDTNADSTIDTGRVDPASSITVLMVWDSPSSAALGTFTTTVTAVSITDPSGPKALTLTTTVANGVVPTASPTPTATPSASASPTASPTPSATPAPTTAGSVDCAPSSTAVFVAPTTTGNGNAYTPTSYVFHNGDTPGATTTQANMSMNTLTPYNATLPQYSSARSAFGGRLVDASTVTSGAQALALTNTDQYAGWRYPIGSKPKLVGGTAVVRIWVAGATGALANPKLSLTLFDAGGSTSNVLSYQTFTVTSSCAGFQELSLALPISGTPTLAKNRELGLRVTNVGTSSVRLAYDVTTTYAATLTIAVK